MIQTWKLKPYLCVQRIQWYKPCWTVRGHIFFIILIIPSLSHIFNYSTNAHRAVALSHRVHQTRAIVTNEQGTHTLDSHRTYNSRAISAHIYSLRCSAKISLGRAPCCRELLRSNMYSNSWIFLYQWFTITFTSIEN